tara:strand:- start:5676 stop:7019 length:1344 start_codon:yes stop_codon:yes gene_type:complete
MDKSPAYENFMNKMSAMSGRPKMNVTTMNIGLEKRVANNERKITSIKNIFKAQKIDIGDKISPKTTPLQESLSETNEVLQILSFQLKKDFTQRQRQEQELLQSDREKFLDEERSEKEKQLEVKKVEKFSKKTAKVISKPFVNIFDKLKQLAGILGTGLFINNFMNLLKKPEFVEKMKKIFGWLKENWKIIAIGVGVLLGAKLVLAFTAIVSSLTSIVGIITSSAFIGIAGAIIASQYKALGTAEKRVISMLQMMGGITTENRLKLAEQLKEELYSIKGLDLYGNRDFLNRQINFLETGVTGTGAAGSSQLDWSILEKGGTLEEAGLITPYESIFGKPLFGFRRGGYTGDGDKNDVKGVVHAGEYVFNAEETKRLGVENLLRLAAGAIPGINVSTITRDIIDARKRGKVNKMSNTPATFVEHINPINSSNPYMNEVPMLFGFNDLVYS